MNLFQTDEFTLSSGKRSNLKIDCDALTGEDIETLAGIVIRRLTIVRAVHSVPHGGDRLAAILDKHYDGIARYKSTPILIVDDVLTTGRSMETERLKHPEPVRGVVIFARAPCPTWITPIFQFWEQP